MSEHRLAPTMDYALLKLLHQGAVTVSIAGFVLRAAAGIGGARWVRGRAARTLPHLVDTVLLASAVGMVWMARWPLSSPWLVAKLAALLAYIGLGMIAMRPRFGKPARSVAAAAAILCFAYMVSVAITKDPAGFAGSAAATVRLTGPPDSGSSLRHTRAARAGGPLPAASAGGAAGRAG